MTALDGYLRAMVGTVQLLTVLEHERRVLELRRHPWCAELHWRLTCRLYELAVDEQLLLHARARLLGERYRPVEIEPPTRPVSPSEQITEAGRALSDLLRAAMG